MSDPIKHECGIALIRLKKPLDFYKEKYGTYLYGLNKLYLLMEKQHNRGQDGAGAAVIKLDAEPGNPYIFRKRSDQSNAISKIFNDINTQISESGFLDSGNKEIPEKLADAPFVGELLLGHLRYGTHGCGGIQFCHPFIRQNNWMSKNLVLAGNFNLTNNDELFQKLIDLGQHPRERSDTVTVLERVGHALDEENDTLFRRYKEKGFTKLEISEQIAQNLSVEKVLKKAGKDFDGGYAIAGLIGHGDAFVLRDPYGIRPAYWFEDDEVVVITSERPPIKTAFNIRNEYIKEVKPGHAIIMRKNGEVFEKEILPSEKKTACSFERIYFSRGTDSDIYRERKDLGRLVLPAVLKSVDHDIENTVFSYIPNTAEVAFFGMMKAVHEYLNAYKKKRILEGNCSEAELDKILSLSPRAEKIAVKDAKLRTFITADAQRGDLVSHVYDTTYGVIRPKIDNLVIIDDSIVRGTTLRNSILRILDRLRPKKIVVVSSAPQIRFPDCYGIDMSKLKDFVAFRAAIELLKESGRENIIEEVYKNCKDSASDKFAPNHVKAIYEPFTDEEISTKIGQLLKNENIKAEIEIIYQKVDDLHKACPDHKGDWYFTGNYPTRGGNGVANRSFVNFYEGSDKRAY